MADGGDNDEWEKVNEATQDESRQADGRQALMPFPTERHARRRRIELDRKEYLVAVSSKTRAACLFCTSPCLERETTIIDCPTLTPKRLTA